MGILKTAIELGEMLKESTQNKEYKKAEEIYVADMEAQILVSDYNAKRLEYAKKIQEEGLSREDAQIYIDELGEDYKMMEQNDIIGAYIDAKNMFDTLYKEAISLIESTVTGIDPSCDKSKCGSCGGCN